MSNSWTLLTRTLTTTKQRLAGWTWLAIAAKLGLWALAFVALAHIGTGTTARLLGAVPLSPAAPDGTHPPMALVLEPPAHLPADSSEQSVPTSACRHRDGGAPDDGGSAAQRDATTEDGRIILNRAAESDLVKLPGIGPQRARAIIALRDRIRRFRRVEDLLRVRGIGRRTLRRLRPLVVVDPPAER